MCNSINNDWIFFSQIKPYLFFTAAARSRCRRFLNQLPTCVGVKPVACANSRFLVGFGYGSCKYHSRNKLRVRSLKQWVFCSPSQIVLGIGNFLRTRYLSTGPNGRPRTTKARARSTASFLFNSKKFGCATGNDHRKRARRSTSPLSSKVSQTLATCSLLKLSIGTGGTGGKKAAAGAGKAANAPDAVLNGTHMAGASGLCPNKPSRLKFTNTNRISGGGGSSSSNSKVAVVGKIFTIRKYQPAWPVQVNIVPVAETRGGARWRLSVKIC
ncbi:hypothetical protein T11_16276 [Trichinella zimbabwensis]|uniref:Uncharacterized protein n=1 Tax=Trichinella zimbabwensis TaxID=268475 RepID=A0A0V1I4A4_9BILA|nr:hypothetical protein T11_16276 [Trichinella zimbabwensis]